MLHRHNLANETFSDGVYCSISQRSNASGRTGKILNFLIFSFSPLSSRLRMDNVKVLLKTTLILKDAVLLEECSTQLVQIPMQKRRLKIWLERFVTVPF